MVQSKGILKKIDRKRVMHRINIGLALIFIAFCMLVLGLKWIVFPNLNSYRFSLAQYASEQLGELVSIQSMSGDWQGLQPQLQLKGITVAKPDGQVGLQVRELKMTLSWFSFLSMGLRFNHIDIDQPELSISRDSNGLLHIAGVPIPASEEKDSPGLNWLLRQDHVWIRNAWVHWHDETQKTPDLNVLDLNFSLKNGFGRHRLSMLARVPEISNEPLSLAADFAIPVWESRFDNWQVWKGAVYGRAHLPDLSFFKSWLSKLPLKMNVKGLDAQAWLDFKDGQATRATVLSGMEGLVLADPHSDVKPFSVKQVSALAEVSAQNSLSSPDGISLKGLRGRFADGQPFGPADLSISRVIKDSQKNWQVSVQNLDATQAKRLAVELGQNLGQREQATELGQYSMAGKLKRVRLTWSTPVSQPDFDLNQLTFNSDVSVENLSIQHRQTLQDGSEQITGFKGITGEFKGNNANGTWQVSSTQFELALPEVFSTQSLSFNQVQGKGSWKNLFDANKPLDLEIESLKASNPDITADVHGRYEFHQDSADYIDLSGQIEKASVSQVPKYLPLVVGPGARSWLKDNLKAGQAKNGTLHLQGSLADFPFHEQPGKGMFEIKVPVENGEITYAPGWPAIRDIRGLVTFKGKTMTIVADSAQTQGVNLNQVTASIPNLDAWEPMLNIDGEGQGALSNMVAFVNTSPVTHFIGDALASATTEGPAGLKLHLNIPLADASKTQVKGTLTFQNNGLKLVRGMPEVTALNGSLDFSNQGLMIGRLRGRALGDAVTFSGKTDSSGRLAILARGTAQASGLAQYIEPAIGDYLKGATPYTVNVLTGEGQLNVKVNSDLKGLGVALPEPFAKPEESVLPFKLNQLVNDTGETWSVQLGKDSNPIGKLLAKLVPNGKQSRFKSLSFGVGAPLESVQSGVSGIIRAKSVDVDAWRNVLGVFNPQEFSASKLKKDSLIGMMMGKKGGYPSTRVSIQADQVKLGKKQFESVWLTARTIEERWQFDVKANGVDGYLSWVSDSRRPDGAVLARFKTLTIPKSLDSDVKSMVEEPVSSIPALDVQVDNFSINDLKLGKLTLLAFNQTKDERARAVLQDKPKEWRLEKMEIDNPDTVVKAHGIWRYGQNMTRQSTDIDIDQTVNDAGGLLTRLGMAGVFKGGKGTLKGHLKWDDAPTTIDEKSLSGQFKLTSTDGQFLKADPGVAKLLGVLSLQSIPRRFTLDFKDLFSKGFAYDKIDANVSLKDGLASTKNFKMEGPSATVLMQGNLDLKNETQNLDVVVLPDLNPTGGSLIYSLIAANPAVGLASIIADLVLKNPLGKVFSFQYKVTGPWAKPDIERIKTPKPSADKPVAPPTPGQ